MHLNTDASAIVHSGMLPSQTIAPIIASICWKRELWLSGGDPTDLTNIFGQGKLIASLPDRPEPPTSTTTSNSLVSQLPSIQPGYERWRGSRHDAELSCQAVQTFSVVIRMTTSPFNNAAEVSKELPFSRPRKPLQYYLTEVSK